MNERRAQNREQRNAYERALYARNREQRRAYLTTWKAANKDRVLEQQRARHRRIDPAVKRQRNRLAHLRQHGMYPEDWALLWESQEGCCYLCGDVLGDGRQVHIDHDHRHCPRNQSCSACRRGIACFDCNIVLGHMRDDPDRLRRMADALEAAQALVTERLADEPMQLELGI